MAIPAFMMRSAIVSNKLSGCQGWQAATISSSTNSTGALNFRRSVVYARGLIDREIDVRESISVAKGVAALLLSYQSTASLGRGRKDYTNDATALGRRKEIGTSSSLKKRKNSRTSTRIAASRVQYNAPKNPKDLPLWLSIWVSSYQTLKSALQFLWEQPRQLQYIEWPSLQSTIKMAVLTVVVVAFLIVFLATIDSTFSYVLSSILRRVPQ